MVRINEKNSKEIINYLARYDKIYLYGAGSRAKKVLNILQNLEIEIVAIVVSELGNNPKEIMGISVVQIDSVVVNEENVFIIGVSEQYIKEIEEILMLKGHTNILELSHTVEKWKLNRALPKLEITAKIGCCIQCKFCPQGVLYSCYFAENRDRCTEMNLDEFKRCINHMPKETIITFAGFVEPFLHPQGVEMILYAHEMGHPVELYTTFVGLTLEQFEIIKEIPFREVVLHTPDIKGYANIPITEEYVKILNAALDLRKANGEPFIDSANCQSEPSEEFLKIANGRIHVESALVDRAGSLEDESLKKSEFKYNALICNRSGKQNHWVLLPDGTVVLCCMDFGLRHQLGNLLDSSYEKIIEGKEYQEVRSNMCEKYNNTYLLCRQCTSSRELPSK